jgi:DNA-directed RNA polymerase specialized sigma24 family protein
MAQYRRQKNLTVTPEQKVILEQNFGKMQYAEIGKIAGISLNKTVNNLKVLEMKPG